MNPPLPLLVRRLEELLVDGPPAVERLVEIAPADQVSAEELGLAFRVAQGSAIRRGPSTDDAPTPARLLDLAWNAAAAGFLPLATPIALCRELDVLAGKLRVAGAWRADVPLWWEPIAEPVGRAALLADAWAEISRLLTPPDRDALRTAFADGPGHLRLPELVPEALLAELALDLQRAHAAGALDLERAAVGDGRISTRRSDAAVYVSGREPALLASAPRLAAFLQWSLHHLPRAFSADGPRLFAPQNAMLARYPAPSSGYAPHLDNPGAPNDNGRSRTLVVYLNPPDAPCLGGEIVLWPPDTSPRETPADVLPAHPGSAALFDARRVVHQVRPLLEGPPRWAMTVWLSDTPQRPIPPTPPAPGLLEALLPIDAPPLPEDRIAVHVLREAPAPDEIRVWTQAKPIEPPRCGIVATVYRGGRELDTWCTHHLALGFAHLVLIFDHPDDPAEAIDLARLRAAFPAERLTLWRGDAALGASGATWAVAARQTLNADRALEAARRDQLGGAPLDWLLHLDADERFHLQGDGRGGAHLADHFAAAQAQGIDRLRYANHELLTIEHGTPVFKRNPREASARLGRRGFESLLAHLGLSLDGQRPYFRAYHNGKSAVRVAAAKSAAGVHGWELDEPRPHASLFVAGPSILHYHAADADAFLEKYRAAAPGFDDPRRPFAPSPVEEMAVGLLRELAEAGATEEEIVRRMEALHARLTGFREQEARLLEEAGLLVRVGG